MTSSLPPHPLHGSCACERNQYTVLVPSNTHEARQAQVFFDNSASSRRPLASPVTAWLRVPLSWYNSTTYPFFPDETHASIKRTFYAPVSNNSSSSRTSRPPIRRQFCGYCGTHLTAWDEGLGSATTGAEGLLDVTLGSLLGESLERLEELRIWPSEDEEEEGEEVEGEENGNGGAGRVMSEASGYAAQGGLRTEGAEVNAETHVGHTQGSQTVRRRERLHRLTGKGVPYFEELVQDSRLGRLKRQRGGGVSADGSTIVQWEVVEIGDDGDSVMAEGSSTVAGMKRSRHDS